MVIEVLAKKDPESPQGRASALPLSLPADSPLALGLEFLSQSLSNQSPNQATNNPGLRPWCIVEDQSAKDQVYIPALPFDLRKACAERRIIWIRNAHSKDLPQIVHRLLDSHLCQGVMLRGFDGFDHKSENSTVWTRRWELASKKTSSHLIWLHEKPFVTLGIDLKIAWDGRGWALKKGHRYLEPDSKEGKWNFEQLKKVVRVTQPSAA